VGNPLHHATITQENVGIVIDDIMSGTIKLRRQRLLCQRHANTIGNTLAQRPGGSFDTGGIAVFRMARGLRVQLTKLFQVINR